MRDIDQANRPRPHARFVRLALGVGIAGLAISVLASCNTSGSGETPSVDYEAARFGSPEIDTADAADY